MINNIKHHISRFIDGDKLFIRLLRNSGWLLSANTISMALVTIQGFVVARLLGASDLGIVGLITAFTSTVNRLVDSRVWETAIKFMTDFLEKKNTQKATAIVKLCYLVDSITGTVTWILIMITADLAARIFIKDETAGHLIRLFAFTSLINIPLGTSTALLRIANRFNWLAYQNVTVSAFRFTGVLFVLLAGYKVKGVLYIYIAAYLIGAIMMVVMSLKVINQLELTSWKNSPLSLLKGEYKKIFNFLVSTNGNAILKLLQRNADILLIGVLFNTTQAGYYKIARSITDMMVVPTGPLYATSYPEFSRLWSIQKYKELWQLIRKIFFSSTAIAILGLLIVSLTGQWIISLTAGPEYLPALPTLIWLAIGTTLAIATNFGHPLLLASGKASSSLLAFAAGVIAQLAFLGIFLPKLGIIAAGMAFVVFYIVWIVVMTIIIIPLWRTNSA